MQNFQNPTVSVTADVQKAQFSELLARLSQLHEDPIEGMAGYLVTEDPTYLPDDPHIKILIRSIGRDKLLRLILARALGTFSPAEEV